jgi:hypothetical protein
MLKCISEYWIVKCGFDSSLFQDSVAEACERTFHKMRTFLVKLLLVTVTFSKRSLVSMELFIMLESEW